MNNTIKNTYETLAFLNRWRINEKLIKELDSKISALIEEEKTILDENGFSWLGYKKHKKEFGELPQIEELKKKINIHCKTIEEIKKDQNILILAAELKEQHLKNNIKIAAVAALKELNLVGKNLTDLRKEKLCKKIMSYGAISSENTLNMYAESYTQNAYRVYFYLGSCPYGSDIEAHIYAYDIENAEKYDVVEILSDNAYMELAKKFIEEKSKIEEEEKAFLEKINAKKKEVKNYFNNYKVYVNFEK